MSLLSKLAKKAGKALKKIAPIAAPLIGGPVGTILGGIAGGRGGGGGVAAPPTMNMGMFPALPPIAATIGRSLPAVIPRVLPGLGTAARAGGAVARVARSPAVKKWGRRAINAAGWYTVGSAVFDAAGNYMGQVGRRRMNPLNHRALRRAISRVKSAKKICAQVERIAGPRRARAAPCPPRGRKC